MSMSYNAIIALDWAIIALSLFNTIAFLWLGLTVLLNAERRHFGTWAAGGGLIVGGLFFAGHSTVVGHDLLTIGPDVEFWWRVSWLPVVGAPYLWYVVAAWYTGVLRAGRHRVWLAIATTLGLAALVSLVVANPLPSYSDVITRTPVPVLQVAGLPVVMLVYPIYSTLCILLALGALRRPAASERFMGDEARRRARPWLIAASLVLLGVTILLAVAVAVFLGRVQARLLGNLPSRTLVVMMTFDLLISGLVAVAIVLIGRAIVSYEIFTGKALPRGGLFSYWRRGLALAAGYGGLMGLTLSLPGVADIDPIYRLLLATILMTLFYALLGWRSYADRERNMESLRPFVASQRLYERMLRPIAPIEVDIAAPFRALCEDVLGATVAYLGALGPLAPLVGPVLAYSDEQPKTKEQGATSNRQNNDTPLAFGLSSLVADLGAQLGSPNTMCVPVEADRYGGAVWAIPLWSERGLIGALLLGEKRHGGLYTQEEIEIARATGERLIDTRASAELTQRLMALQRQRLVESQVVDQRTRRALHDDVLPRLHTAMLMLEASGMRFDPSDDHPSPSPQASNLNGDEVVELLADVHRQIANLLHAMPATAAPEVARLGLVGALRQAVDGEFGGDFDAVTWQVAPEAEHATSDIPPLAAEVCFYAAREVVRNAARYGRNGDPARPLHLAVSIAWRNGLELRIEDDGVGLVGAQGSPERVAGQADATIAGGSGHGLGLHGTLMAVVGGTLIAESKPGAYTRVSLSLPQSAWD
jgi:signal transduction histidine kinase